MRLGVVIGGIILILAGLSMIIIAANEIQTLNTCTQSSYCFTDPFFWQTTVRGIYSAAYSILEIGILFAVTGAIVTLLGSRAQPQRQAGTN